jgi:hypothetical protein
VRSWCRSPLRQPWRRGPQLQCHGSRRDACRRPCLTRCATSDAGTGSACHLACRCGCAWSPRFP